MSLKVILRPPTNFSRHIQRLKSSKTLTFPLLTHTQTQTYKMSTSSSSTQAKIIKTTDLKTEGVKWLKLSKIDWEDQDGKARVWETAERSTRKGEIDAVAIFTLIHHPSKPISTVIIEQFRPPIGKYVVELPAGLVDEGEEASTTALRELHEETGYGQGEGGGKATVVDVSPIIVSDPGMSSANMKLVTIKIQLSEKDTIEPKPKLEEGEHIVKRLVAVKDLWEVLLDYDKKGFQVDARLSHLAYGLNMAKEIEAGSE